MKPQDLVARKSTEVILVYMIHLVVLVQRGVRLRPFDRKTLAKVGRHKEIPTLPVVDQGRQRKDLPPSPGTKRPPPLRSRDLTEVEQRPKQGEAWADAVERTQNYKSYNKSKEIGGELSRYYLIPI